MDDDGGGAGVTREAAGTLPAPPASSRPDTATTRSALAVAALPALGALLLYLFRIGTPALWLDEAATAGESGRSLSGLLGFLAGRDAGLGAYYLFMHGWTSFGDGEAWLRFPSAIAMAATVGVLADLGRRWWGSGAGVAAGLLPAVSPMASRYAQEARPYALAVLFAVAAAWCLWQAAESCTRAGACQGPVSSALPRSARSERSARRWWIAYTVAVATLGVVHVVALVVLVAHPLLLRAAYGRTRQDQESARPEAGRQRSGPPWRAYLLATGAGLVLPALVAVAAFGERATVSWIPPTSRSVLVDTFVALAGSGPYLLLLGALAAIGALRAARGTSRTEQGRLLAAPACWLVGPPLVLAGLGLLTPVFLPRYLLVCAPALALLASSAFAVPGGSRTTAPTSTKATAVTGAGVTVAVALAVAVAWSSLAQVRGVTGHGPDIRSAAGVVAAGCRPGDGVQRTVSTVQTLPYYLRHARCVPRWLDGGLPDGLRRVWVVQPDWQHGDPPGVTGLRHLRTVDVPGLRVSLWTRTGPPG
ncbi:glycosyltransferase family 39 protein [Actinopolymorpha sp. NPDC004070]|uniref:glycosyltransferase family 39 protein n=1 Tax=Actinopolymorpha sp. NPDC004070 TaxID=3154548 RepID=UPI0033B38867